MRYLLSFLLICGCCNCTIAQQQVTSHKAIQPGAYRLQAYLPYLKNKRVAVFANNTSMVGNTHLVDTLQQLGVKIVKIFAPEHGFRGTADAGEEVGNDRDKKTGIQIVSLYGDRRTPTANDLADVDIILFDIQDVGARFYTYQGSLQYLMEGAFVNRKPLIILDRPNPNGFYVDGPILDTAYKAFIGMQPVPIVYGMTIGEYARMIAGEKWLTPAANKVYSFYETAAATADTPVHFLVIKCGNYTHKSRYELPVNPSPNLKSNHAILMYTSTCLFEGTVLSEGRGTEAPFEIFGHPSLPKNMYSFTPKSNAGAKDPKLKDQLCYGWNIKAAPVKPQLQLQWLLQAYQLFGDKDKFFIQPKSGKKTDVFFNKLAGSDQLMQQIIAGKTEAQIRASWQPGLEKFKQIRKKYLLYTDF